MIEVGGLKIFSVEEIAKKFGYYPSGVVKKKPKELASRTYHN